MAKNDKISYLDLIDRTAKDLNMPKYQLKKIIKCYNKNLADAISTDKAVEVTGFGTFKQKNSVLRNDKRLLEGETLSGKKKKKHHYKSVGFIPSIHFKKRLTQMADKKEG